MIASLVIAASLVAQTRAIVAVDDRDDRVIYHLEPIPTASPGAPLDASWRPTLGPGEYLVPGSVRDVRVHYTAYQETTKTPPAPSPSAAPSSSCYSGSYSSQSSAQVAQSYSFPVLPSPSVVQFAPLYAAPAAPLFALPERRPLFRHAIRERTRIRIDTRSSLSCGPFGCR